MSSIHTTYRYLYDIKSVLLMVVGEWVSLSIQVAAIVAVDIPRARTE
jgi:hypothetical protein